MKKLFALAALSAVFAFASCDKPTTGENPVTGDPTVVKFSSSISAMKTRVANDKFEDSERVGIYMFLSTATGGGYTDANALSRNVEFVTKPDGSLFAATSTITYPEADGAEKPVAFIAYYPYTTHMSDFRIDLADQSGGLAKEYLYSINARNVFPSANPVALDFRYMLPKLTVRVLAGTGIAEQDILDKTSVSITGMANKGFPDIFTGNITHEYEPSMPATMNISMFKNRSDDGSSVTFEALVLPVSPGIVYEPVFTFTIAGNDGIGKTYTHKLSSATYQGGYEYELEFTINDSDTNPGTDVKMSATATITPRQEADGGSYTVQ
jgi:hypothetical protein